MNTISRCRRFRHNSIKVDHVLYRIRWRCSAVLNQCVSTSATLQALRAHTRSFAAHDALRFGFDIARVQVPAGG